MKSCGSGIVAANRRQALRSRAQAGQACRRGRRQARRHEIEANACSAGIVSGAFLDGCLSRRGIASGPVLAVGLKLMTGGSVLLLAVKLGDVGSPALLAGLLIVVALAFGLSVPNLVNAAMQPLPEIAGAVSATAGSVQLTAGDLINASRDRRVMSD